MSKPQGYGQALAETCWLLMMKCGPYESSLLLAMIGGAAASLLLACLLLFVVECSPEIRRTIAVCLTRLPHMWIAPILSPEEGWAASVSFDLPNAPRLASAFQRPPPLFS